MKSKNFLMKNLMRKNIVLMFVSMMTVALLHALPADTSIKINVTGAAPGRLVGLTIIDETTGLLVLSKNYFLEGIVNATNENGFFTKTIKNLNPAHRYTIFIKIDIDKSVNVSSDDKGQIIKNIAPGSIVLFDDFDFMGNIELAARKNNELAGKTGICYVGMFNYTLDDLLILDKIQYLSATFVFYDESGNSDFQPAFLPQGTYSNLLCFIDNDNSQSVSSGDYYQIIDDTVNIKSADEKLKFSLKSWLMME